VLADDVQRPGVSSSPTQTADVMLMQHETESDSFTSDSTGSDSDHDSNDDDDGGGRHSDENDDVTSDVHKCSHAEINSAGMCHNIIELCIMYI